MYLRNDMLKPLLILILLIQTISSAYAQVSPTQRIPGNGENGWYGSTPRSFIVQWDTLADVDYYEYVISDNSLCFAGCSGDTRHGTLTNNFAVERNLMLNKWYYWIIRAVMKNEDTTFYSPIHSFYTLARPEDSQQYFTLGPNTITNASMDIRVAWPIDPQINSFNYNIFNSFGELLKTSGDIFPEKNELKQTEIFPVGLIGFQPGLYFIEVNTNISKVPERLKFLICQ